jgi:hypothetical protein
MRKILGICVALCLGFVWGCAEVEVLIPSHQSGPKEPPYDPRKPSITLDTLKQMQMQGTREICDRKDSKTLEVPREKQQTPAWCWAASTRMVMEYHNKKQKKPTDTDPQCAIVKKIWGPWVGEVNCCEGQSAQDFINAPSKCVQGGWPDWVLANYQFSNETVRGALDWEALIGEICTTGPFIPVVDLRGGGKHAFIVTGYSGRPSQVVTIYNPTTEDFQDLTFEEFVGDSPGPDGFYGFSHNLNFVQISPKKAEDQS